MWPARSTPGSWLRPGEALKPVLEATPMTVPAVPVYHNYTAAPAKDAAELRANLAAQVAGSVRWEECVRAMVAAGGDAMIEFGPGNVLTGCCAGRCPMCRTSMSTAWSRSTRSLSEGTGRGGRTAAVRLRENKFGINPKERDSSMSCEKRLEGKVALVTGGARGIGKAISARLAAEGAKLAIVDIMLDVAQATADEFSAQGIEARAYAANVAKFEDAENTVAAVVRDFGRLDILVNNAGITKDTLMLKMTEDMWDAVIAVNLKGTFNFTKAAVRPMMKQRAGKIVNIASVVGRMGNVGQANYSASKAGVIALAKTTAKEFATGTSRSTRSRRASSKPR